MKRGLPAHSLQKIALRTLWLVCVVLLSACMDYDPRGRESIADEPRAVFVVAEGNFMYGNASLDLYFPDSKRSELDAFGRANGRDVGDVAQSLTIYRGKAYLVVNNSGVVYELDPHSYRLLGGFKGLTSPRYMHFVSPTKAYITDLYASGITIVDPSTRRRIGFISTDGHRSTEQMVQVGQYVFVSCWSYDDTLLVLDTTTDKIVGEIQVGIQPSGLLLDGEGKLWVLCSGGYAGSPYGSEAPSLWRIDPHSRGVERRYDLARGDKLIRMALSPDGKVLYWIGSHLWQMPIDATELPKAPLHHLEGAGNLYALGVDPATGELYIGDALDYTQPAEITRLSSRGEVLDRFRVGINPSSFVFR